MKHHFTIADNCMLDNSGKVISNFKMEFVGYDGPKRLLIDLTHKHGWQVGIVVSPETITTYELNKTILGAGLMSQHFVFSGSDEQLKAILLGLPNDGSP